MYSFSISPTDLDDRNICPCGFISETDFFFYEIREMWDDLDRSPEIVSSSFLHDDLFIELPTGKWRILIEVRIEKSLIVPDIEIRLCSIICDEYFPMLIWTHRPWIDIEISIELLTKHLESRTLEDRSDRCRGNAFSDTRENSTRDK